jgi:galactokinase
MRSDPAHAEANVDPRRTGARVAEAFRRRWGVEPEFVLRAPGRINLIGDHTDYSLLPVLPMAINRGLSFAVGPAPDGCTIDSLDEPAALRLGTTPAQPASLRLGTTPAQPASWHPYAIHAAALLDCPRGLRVLVAGDLPMTGGLSSSSALVVGLLAALTRDSQTPLRGQALVEAAIEAERRAAIEGGAMDQTVIVFGQPGHALRIDFDPPARRPVAIAEGLVFVAADSGTRAAKSAEARDAYNARVVAGRCAAAWLAHAQSIAPPAPLVLGHFANTLREAIDALPESTSAAAVAARTHAPLDALVRLTAGRFDADRSLPLRSVAQHVIAEAAAVDVAESALKDGDLAHFGALLRASHESLRRFGTSTPELDRLTAAMNQAGAFGARVTGAGFGGYAIAACRPERVEDVIAAARRATGGPAFPVAPAGGLA